MRVRRLAGIAHIRQQARAGGHRRDARQPALEADFAVFQGNGPRRVCALGAEQILKPGRSAASIVELRGGHGRPQQFAAVHHKGAQQLGGLWREEGLEQRHHRAVRAAVHQQLAAVRAGEFLQLFLGDVVAIAVLHHPGAEALIGIVQLRGIQGEHRAFAVAHILHQAVLQAAGAVGRAHRS